MKKLRTLIVFIAMLCCCIASAEDFEVGGIYYNIISTVNKTVEVTHRGFLHDSYDDEYSGSVVIPSSVIYNGKTYSVASIGLSAFSGCSGLTSITIPNSVRKIGNYAFSFCSGLKEITIPNRVRSIGKHAFSFCSGLTSITIPEGVTSIGESTFYGCSGLKGITIPEGVTSIGDDAFFNCSGLKEITIPNSVTSIGNYAFSFCKGLMSITIPESVTSIGERAFQNCSGLMEIAIPEGVTSIGNYAFEDCSGLKEITIPNSVTSIGDYAFEDCSGLKEITIAGSIVFVTNKAKTVHITLTDLAAWIKNHPSFSSYNENIHLYLNGEEITELAIPNDVTTIKDNAFLNYTGLTSIIIPKGMTEIGDEAFMGCSNIKKIVCNATTPPTAYYDTFTGINKEKCVLMVPEGTEALYKEAKRWKDFLVIESIPSAIEQVAGPTADKGDIYDLSGRLVKTQAEGMDGLAPGVYVKNGKKYIVK